MAFSVASLHLASGDGASLMGGTSPFEGFTGPYFTSWTYASYRLVELTQTQIPLLIVTHTTVQL